MLMFPRMPPKMMPQQQDGANTSEWELLPPRSPAGPAQPLNAERTPRSRTRLSLPHHPVRPTLPGASAWLWHCPGWSTITEHLNMHHDISIWCVIAREETNNTTIIFINVPMNITMNSAISVRIGRCKCFRTKKTGQTTPPWLACLISWCPPNPWTQETRLTS